MFEQLSVATAMSSPIWPVDMPGAVSTQRQGFVGRVLAERGRHRVVREPLAAVGALLRRGVPPRPVRERVRAVPGLAPVPERGELLALRVVGVALERLVGLRVVEAQRGEDAGLEDGLRPDRRVDEAGVGVAAVRGSSARAVVVEREPGSATRRPGSRSCSRARRHRRFALVPTNARWAAWVPLYLHGLLLPFLHFPRRVVRGVVVVPVEARS